MQGLGCELLGAASRDPPFGFPVNVYAGKYRIGKGARLPDPRPVVASLPVGVYPARSGDRFIILNHPLEVRRRERSTVAEFFIQVGIAAQLLRGEHDLSARVPLSEHADRNSRAPVAGYPAGLILIPLNPHRQLDHVDRPHDRFAIGARLQVRQVQIHRAQGVRGSRYYAG